VQTPKADDPGHPPGHQSVAGPLDDPEGNTPLARLRTEASVRESVLKNEWLDL